MIIKYEVLDVKSKEKVKETGNERETGKWKGIHMVLYYVQVLGFFVCCNSVTIKLIGSCKNVAEQE